VRSRGLRFIGFFYCFFFFFYKLIFQRYFSNIFSHIKSILILIRSRVRATCQFFLRKYKSPLHSHCHPSLSGST
jgi:hypothetical protein